MANVIVYAPHQDDDILSFGPAMLQHLAAGDNVVTVLVTDGSKSAVRTKLNGGSNCSWHAKTHNPLSEGYGYRIDPLTGQPKLGMPLSEYDFSQSRNAEYYTSMDHLGVQNIYIGKQQVDGAYYSNEYDILDFGVKGPYVDGTLTVAQAKSIILHFEAMYPGAEHKAQTWLDAHPDHAAVGQALKELFAAGLVTDARFFVKPSFVDEFKATSGIATFSSAILTAAQKTILTNAADKYKYWSPSLSRYGIGEHSVPGSFDLLLANPRSTIHRP